MRRSNQRGGGVTLAQNFRVSLWCRNMMLGSAESEYPRLTNCDIIFEDFQPMWYGQTTCRSNTVLCVASRGNDRDRAPGQGSALLVTFVVVCKFYTPLPVPRHGTGPRLFHLQCDSCKFDTVLQSRSLDGTKSPRKKLDTVTSHIQYDCKLLWAARNSVFIHKKISHSNITNPIRKLKNAL